MEVNKTMESCIYLLSSDGYRESINLHMYASNDVSIIQLLTICLADIGYFLDISSVDINYTTKEVHYQYSDDESLEDLDNGTYHLIKIPMLKIQ